jgi:hypothetical protein
MVEKTPAPCAAVHLYCTIVPQDMVQSHVDRETLTTYIHMRQGTIFFYLYEYLIQIVQYIQLVVNVERKQVPHHAVLTLSLFVTIPIDSVPMEMVWLKPFSVVSLRQQARFGEPSATR